jgi:alpha-galactosidase
MPKRITIIGGGSATFTPQLVRLFIESDVLKGSTIVLMDVDQHRLQVMDTLASQLVEAEAADLTIESTASQRESLVDADFVITAIAVGGADAYELDIEIPGRYGIYMHVCDSVGPGGISRALRHIPVLTSVCQDLEEVSPRALLFNYANPLAANCMAMRRTTSIEVTGLCTCSTIPQNAEYLARLTGIDAGDLLLPAPAAGINHCAGVLRLGLKDGRNALSLLKERVGEPVIKWGLETYGVLPYCWSHWTEFFPSLCRLEESYQGRLQGMRMQYDMKVFDMEDPECPGSRARGRRWEQVVESWIGERGAGRISADSLPSAESVQIVGVMEALLENRNEVHVVNVPNRGAIGNLPDDAIVEVSATVGGYGITPIHVGNLPDSLAATLRSHIAAQELTVQAALTGDRKVALRAFLHDPQIASVLTPQETERMLDEMLEAHAAYLPQFS